MEHSISEKPRLPVYLSEVGDVFQSDAFFKTAEDKLRSMSDRENTLRHSRRVVNIGCLLAKHLKFSEEKMEDFIEACFLHDIGKTKIRNPEALMRPEGEFTKEDWEIISEHARMGYLHLREAGRSPRVYNPVLLHHAFQDQAYPEIGIEAASLTEEDIDMARLLAMVDVFDTCVFGRDNIRSIPIEQAKAALMKQFGETGDKELINFLERNIETIKMRDHK